MGTTKVAAVAGVALLLNQNAVRMLLLNQMISMKLKGCFGFLVSNLL